MTMWEEEEAHTLWLDEFTLLDTGAKSAVELGVELGLRGDRNGVVVLDIFLQGLTAA
jgi:hypothetical protein